MHSPTTGRSAMNPVRIRPLALGLVACWALALPTQAQTSATAPSTATTTPAPAAVATNDGVWAQAEVRRVDREAGKVTLRHGEIKNLDMPPMTMVFTVPERATLQNIQIGDAVRFQAAHENNVYLVKRIEKVR